MIEGRIMEASIEQASGIASSDYPVNVRWVQQMQFVARDERNHSIILDTTPENGGENSGPTPGRLLLMAVAGCTSMDIVDILRKSRQRLTGLSVYSRGVQNKQYPQYYTEIHLFYKVKGVNLDRTRVERAIRLSEEKYCSVGATVKGKAKIFIKYEIEEEKTE
jgi:putative redox protein